jgi:hypothetical protein
MTFLPGHRWAPAAGSLADQAAGALWPTEQPDWEGGDRRAACGSYAVGLAARPEGVGFPRAAPASSLARLGVSGVFEEGTVGRLADLRLTQGVLTI